MPTPTIPEIDASADKARAALATLARDRDALVADIRDRLARGDDAGAAALRADAAKLDAVIANEQDRLAGLDAMREAAFDAEAEAKIAEQLDICRDLAARRVDLADKIDAAVTKLGKAVAALTATSADLDKAVRSLPVGRRPLSNRTDADVIPGLGAALIVSGMRWLFPNVAPNTGDLRTLGQRTRADQARLSR